MRIVEKRIWVNGRESRQYGIDPDDIVNGKQSYPYDNYQDAAKKLALLEWKEENENNDLPIPETLKGAK